MKIIIPGGAGFFGRNLLRVMQEEGVNLKTITVIDKDLTNLALISSFPVKIINADLAELGAWEQEFKGADYVINLAAQISGKTAEPFIRNNITATTNLLVAMKKHKVPRIIHFSSAAVSSIRKDDYAKTKEEGEKLVRTSKIPFVALQPSIMYGPTDTKNIGWLISFARKCLVFPIPGHGKYPRQPIYVDDVCRLIIKMLRNFPKNKVYSINGKDVVMFKEMIDTVLRQMGGFRFSMRIPVWVFRLCMRIGNVVMRNAPFTPDQLDSLTSGDVFPDYAWWDEFGIQITPFEEGVKKMLAKDREF